MYKYRDEWEKFGWFLFLEEAKNWRLDLVVVFVLILNFMVMRRLVDERGVRIGI